MKEKEKKRQYGRERYKNLSEDENQKIIKYRKNCMITNLWKLMTFIRNFFCLENLVFLDKRGFFSPEFGQVSGLSEMCGASIRNFFR